MLGLIDTPAVIRRIGVWAGKVLGMRRIFAWISPNLPKTFLCDFWLHIFYYKYHKDLFWCDLQKKVFVCFSANVGRHFFKTNNVGHQIFARIFKNFAQIFTDFSRIFSNFSRIFDKSKLLGAHLHPLHPRLLHHWFGARGIVPPFPFVTLLRTAHYMVHEILSNHGLSECFEHWNYVDLLPSFLFSGPDASIPISAAGFGAVDEFLKSCKRF